RDHRPRPHRLAVERPPRRRPRRPRRETRRLNARCRSDLSSAQRRLPMSSYYLSEDLARFSEMAKTHPKLFDLFMKWYAAPIERGFEVTVLEQGEVGDGLRRFGPTRFFSPLGMNLPPRALVLLGDARPPDDALLTGSELADRVLVPLAATPALDGKVLTRHRV